MMSIQPLQPWHLQVIDLQAAQEDVAQKICTPEFYNIVSASLPAYALVQQKQGEVLVCYGIQQLWQGRGMVWALLSKNAGRHMRKITWMAKAYLESVQLPRIEAYVRSDFKAGLQWVRLLGFEHEGHMRSFFENAQNAEMYAYLKTQKTEQQ